MNTQRTCVEHVPPITGGARDFVFCACVLLFLFAGLHKGVVAVPGVDSTPALAAACFALLAYHFRAELRHSPLIPWLLLAATYGYLMCRLPLSGELEFGHYKFATAAGFGTVAFAAGLVIGGNARRLHLLCSIWLVLSVLIGSGLVLSALIRNRPHLFNGLPWSGYQLTGYFVGAGIIVTAVHYGTMKPVPKWYSPLLAAQIVAGSVIGCAAGFYAACLLIVALLVFMRLTGGAHGTPGATLKGLALAVVAIVAISSIWRVPVSLSRFASKVEFGVEESASIAGDPAPAVEVEEEPVKMGRIALWYKGLHAFVAAPWLGNELGSFDYPPYRYPHNLAIELLSETGIIGFGLFSLFLLSTAGMPAARPWRTPLANVRHEVIGGICLASFFFAVHMVSGYFISRLLMFSLGVLAAAIHQKSDHPRTALSQGMTPAGTNSNARFPYRTSATLRTAR